MGLANHFPDASGYPPVYNFWGTDLTGPSSVRSLKWKSTSMQSVSWFQVYTSVGLHAPFSKGVGMTPTTYHDPNIWGTCTLSTPFNSGLRQEQQKPMETRAKK
eukprot:CAMPEP_0174333232 /NCGR_PEP_ID=MMETSP0810-20121108/18987_1 /TAXON_ID=73025 ORGANISM="Eutreptiella gymnastica-like, Strain CCMP1594" /NCGR_SAMPLE_ID=MMETSP0810 /ASSEMBLY_ACC=CAM_ASM_000659 /LENGTH=102 /DNA_ID=CAMNT_0015450225 /DNA_START=74 /DNA_END=379 /DNA_ORIENTATION=-